MAKEFETRTKKLTANLILKGVKAPTGNMRSNQVILYWA